jgi:AcrR family transcriptional regulator
VVANSARDRILLTAHDLFYKEGIRATGIDRVIADSGVAKLTFYRHFPSKHALVLAFLDYRHVRWMIWFNDALQRNGGAARGVAALAPALAEWFGSADYRGCAFINSVGELGGSEPDVAAIARAHKQDMIAAIANLMPGSRTRVRDANALGMLVDGAIIRAQMDGSPATVLKAFDRAVKALMAGGD